jgi:tRNA pseudouridine38-40 synthase
MRYFFLVQYNGAHYGGWQSQTNAPSVQETLETAFTTVVRVPCRVRGAGRTDAGVHARAMGAHVDSPVELDLFRMELSVNAILPGDIAIRGLAPVDPGFDARFSARGRWYSYYMVTRKEPLLAGLAWMVTYKIDWEKVRMEMSALKGTHDFSTFCASGSNARSKECTVREVLLENNGALWKFTITADRFIYKMVRSVVGTLIDIGRGRITQPMAGIIDSGNRKNAGETAPAWGLVLERVEY